MRVYLSRYRDHWISPYTILDHVFFWTDWSKCSRDKRIIIIRDEENKYVERPEWTERWANRLEPISRAIQWIGKHIYPTITHVRIDPWDTWNMDGTLSRIILPMLRQLQRDKPGAPLVDPEDVPGHLRPWIGAEETDDQVDETHFLRWDWVVSELIWTFEQLHPDNDWQQQYYSGEPDILWMPVDRDGNQVPRGDHVWFEMQRGPKDTFKVDQKGIDAHQARITNGLRLFGKYFQALWD